MRSIEAWRICRRISVLRDDHRQLRWRTFRPSGDSRRVHALADADGWKASALSFDPHPTKIVARATYAEADDHARAARAADRRSGIEQVLILPFDAATARLTPEEFAESLLARKMGARAVLVGENFRFGCRQAGDVRTLQELGARLGFAVEIVEAVRFRGQVVSSGSIRALISTGRVALAAGC